MNRFIVVFLTIFSIVIPGNAFAQADTIRAKVRAEKHLSLLLGYNLQRYSYGEIGVGVSNISVAGPHAANTYLSLSDEIRLTDKFIMGPKISAWASGGMSGLAMGANLINYTDLKTVALRIRPEIGLGGDHFKLVYGYNFTLTNTNFDGINQHNFGIVAMLHLKKIDRK